MLETLDQPWLLPRRFNAGGRYEGVPVRDGFFLALSDRKFQSDGSYVNPAGDYLKLHFRLEGKGFIRGEGLEDATVEPGLLSFLVQPRDSLKFEREVAMTHERAVTLVCSRDFAASVLSARSNYLPGCIGDFLGGHISRFAFQSVALPPQANALVEDILETRPFDPIGALIVEARALELLYIAVQELQRSASAASRLRERDKRKVLDLCELLKDPKTASCSMAQLGRFLAWNETQMMDCFKRVTGTTISQYRHRIRMERAYRRLRDSEDSVTEVAFAAGYEYPCNFATAFKRMFGFSPKLARTKAG